MANINIIEDANGDTLDYEYFCSDFCAKYSDNYAGWYGCVELYTLELCQTCNTELSYIPEDQGDNMTDYCQTCNAYTDWQFNADLYTYECLQCDRHDLTYWNN